MNDDLNYKTFLFWSNKKIIISVVQSNDLKIIYEKKKYFDELNSTKFEYLNEFLDNNIYNIEKKINSFIKEIYLVLEIEDFFPIQISIKKNNNGNKLTFSSLGYSLNEAKELCFKTFDEGKIIHMIIDNYLIDNKNYSNLPENIRCNNFSLDISFICLPNFLVKKLEKILKKYQISIKQISSRSYIESLFSNDEHNLFEKAKLVADGFNENEVKLDKKLIKNQGFFEKFFNYFS